MGPFIRLSGLAALFGAAALSPLQTMTRNRFDGLLLVIFCGAAWVGVQFLGYVEFDAARRWGFTGSFRRVVSAHIYMSGFQKQLASATSEAEYWRVIRDATGNAGSRSGSFRARGSLKQCAS